MDRIGLKELNIIIPFGSSWLIMAHNWLINSKETLKPLSPKLSSSPRTNHELETFCFFYLKSNEFWFIIYQSLKGVFAKNERGYRLNAIKKRF